jgi:hypothetical protein
MTSDLQDIVPERTSGYVEPADVSAQGSASVLAQGARALLQVAIGALAPVRQSPGLADGVGHGLPVDFARRVVNHLYVPDIEVLQAADNAIRQAHELLAKLAGGSP